MQKLITFISTIFLFVQVMATHNRAGEITYKQVSQLTYEVTITTFTYVLSAADRPQLVVEWGDNTASVVDRIPSEIVFLPDYYKKNVYRATHTFPGPGSYEILVQDPNRNFGVINIPNSVNVIFSVKTDLVINPNVGFNNTPVLLNYPIDKALLGKTFIHNPAAYDPDGDSIAYSMAVCTGENGKPIENYELPESSDTLYIDEITGDLIWNTPQKTGIYNIAINIEEFRNGIKIGNIVRDMQVEVVESDNELPVNPPLMDYCVVAGDFISQEITSTDADRDMLNQFASGGPYVVESSPAQFDLVKADSGSSTSVFSWDTECSHVRDALYYVIIKTEDIIEIRGSDTLKSVDLDNFTVRVLGPPPRNPAAKAGADTIFLNWDPNGCENLSHYNIYRAPGYIDYSPDSCDNSIPEDLGFKLIGSTNNGVKTEFKDTKRNGLLQGITYTYIIAGVFENGVLSISTNSFHAALKQRFPGIIKVSVEKSDPVNGAIEVKWLKPPQGVLDSLNAAAPFSYILYRSEPGTPNSFEQVFTTNNLEDTSYMNTPVNTSIFPYTYKVDLLYTNTQSMKTDTSHGGKASSTYLQLIGKDNEISIEYIKDAPWINVSDSIYAGDASGNLRFINKLEDQETQYTHSGLKNGTEYFYQITGESVYENNGVNYTTLNKTHQASTIPIDSIPPCTPYLNVSSLCDSLYNILNWTFSSSECLEDVFRYHIYYAPDNFSTPARIDTAANNMTRYRHDAIDLMSMGGCYQVSAIDSFGNESPLSSKVCIDICEYYILPNFFTPNNDGRNDIYYSLNLNDFVKQVDMQIFNRWGQLVYETEDPDIAWDGRHLKSKELVSSGVYYYICTAYEPRITGEFERLLTGFIHVYTKNDQSTNNEK